MTANRVLAKEGVANWRLRATRYHNIPTPPLEIARTRFTTIAAGDKFNPHVTIGVAPETFLDEMLAEPFRALTLSPAGASAYQFGTFGSACKKFEGLSLAP